MKGGREGGREDAYSSEESVVLNSSLHSCAMINSQAHSNTAPSPHKCTVYIHYVVVELHLPCHWSKVALRNGGQRSTQNEL